MEKLIELCEIPDVKVFMNTKWLFKRTMKDNFNSADIMVRLLAIDNYYQKNDFGFRFYNEMQKVRVGQNLNISREMMYHESEFISLIQSFEKNGYNVNYPVELNKNFEVFDGSHRLTASLYFDVPQIPVIFHEKYYNKTYDYSLNWFRENHLSYMIPYIEKKYEEIMK